MSVPNGGHPLVTRADEDAEQVHRREYPPNVRPGLVDIGVTAVWDEFERDTWREASLREVVGTILARAVDARL